MPGLRSDSQPEEPEAPLRSEAEIQHEAALAYGRHRPPEARSWTLPEVTDGHLVRPADGEGPRAAYDFVTHEGRRFTVSLATEPVFDLRRGQAVATHVRVRLQPVSPGRGERRLRERISDPHDAERMEILEFRRGMALLQECGAEIGMLPLSWRMAASGHAFTALNSGLKLALDPKDHVVAELYDTPASVGPAELRQVVGAVAERRRSVCMRLPLEAEALDAVAGSGIKGVVFTADPALPQSETAWLRMSALISAARRIVATVVIDGAPAERGPALAQAGATHAVFTKRPPRLI